LQQYSEASFEDLMQVGEKEYLAEVLDLQMVTRIMLDFAQREDFIQLLPVLATRKDRLLVVAERMVVMSDRRESYRVGTTAVEKYLQV
jgi:hypothetical protein